MSTILYPFQERGVEKLDRFEGRALLADQMGLGKTVQVLKWAEQNARRAFPALVVCPASLKYNWLRECRKHLGISADICEGRTPPEIWLTEGHKITIINYDILGHWIPYLKTLGIKSIFWDEAHYLKNPASQRYKNAKKICQKSKHVICMTGTPLTNRPIELWPLLRLIRPDKFSKEDFSDFVWDHCSPRMVRGRWRYDGARNLDELHRKLKKTCMIRRKKSQVLKDLPSKTRAIIRMTLDNEIEYQAAEKDFLGWLAQQSYSKALRASKVEELAKVGYLKRLAAKGKLQAVFDWIDNFLEETDEKIFLVAIHKSIIKLIEERYYRICTKIDGSVKGKKRMAAVDKFQGDRRCRILIGNMQAAGVGLTLTAASSMAFVEFGWTPAEHEQAEDRIHRIGQTRGVFCYYLVAENTIEKKLLQVIKKKQKIADAAIDGDAEAERNNVIDLLLKGYKRGQG